MKRGNFPFVGLEIENNSLANRSAGELSGFYDPTCVAFCQKLARIRECNVHDNEVISERNKTAYIIPFTLISRLRACCVNIG